ncbi:protoporphyrinogen oxidase [Mycobacterium antarcticum]|nr:protoporphyrinogen oxidase [Mycolicibacterium sp. TUM20985]GLP77489.1 protoporphyrinogen oxidase [Mycolicibacterium sp. TUM20983]
MTGANGNPLIIGAGPAGLTAALRLVKRGVAPRIYEATGNVGGLARTPGDGDWRVDPGGHRFFTRSEEVLDLWHSLLPPDQWISVPRRSAMLVDDHYVRYPLLGRDLLFQMGLRRGIRGLSSYLWSRTQRGTRVIDDSADFRDWGTDQFGRYWYDMFFDGYVRKTWLTDPGDITSEWARQRIKPIGWHAQNKRDPAEEDAFRYPIRGPGQLWEAAAARLADSGVVPSLDSRVAKARFNGKTWTVELESGETASGDAVFSSMPLRLLVNALEPAPPRDVRAVAAELKHRALITVAVALGKHYDIPYNWVYTPQEGVKVGRIQNYGLWSGGLAPDGWQGTYLGLEYYFGPTDDLYAIDDESLKRVAAEDLRALGIDDSTVERVMVVRSPFAYPICDPARDRSVARIRHYLRRNYPSLHPIGRNGMHRYDNQDHAMLSAMHSVARYFGENVDPWQVNADPGYHEAGVLKR